MEGEEEESGGGGVIGHHGPRCDIGVDGERGRERWKASSSLWLLILRGNDVGERGGMGRLRHREEGRGGETLSLSSLSSSSAGKNVRGERGAEGNQQQ
jgi:hypothetical protein